MAQARAGIASHLGAMTIATGNLLSVLQPSSPGSHNESKTHFVNFYMNLVVCYNHQDVSASCSHLRGHDLKMRDRFFIWLVQNGFLCANCSAMEHIATFCHYLAFNGDP